MDSLAPSSQHLPSPTSSRSMDPHHQHSESSTFPRRPARLAALLQRRFTSIRSSRHQHQKPPNQQQSVWTPLSSNSTSLLSGHHAAPGADRPNSFRTLRRRTSAPTTLAPRPPSPSTSKRASGPFRLRKDSATPVPTLSASSSAPRSTNSFSHADDFKVRRATTLVADKNNSHSTFVQPLQHHPQVRTRLRPRTGSNRFSLSQPSIEEQNEPNELSEDEDIEQVHHHPHSRHSSTSDHNQQSPVPNTHHNATTNSHHSSPKSLNELTIVPHSEHHSIDIPPPPQWPKHQPQSKSQPQLQQTAIPPESNYTQTIHSNIRTQENDRGDPEDGPLVISPGSSESRVKKLSALFQRADNISTTSSVNVTIINSRSSFDSQQVGATTKNVNGDGDESNKNNDHHTNMSSKTKGVVNMKKSAVDVQNNNTVGDSSTRKLPSSNILDLVAIFETDDVNQQLEQQQSPELQNQNEQTSNDHDRCTDIDQGTRHEKSVESDSVSTSQKQQERKDQAGTINLAVCPEPETVIATSPEGSTNKPQSRPKYRWLNKDRDKSSDVSVSNDETVQLNIDNNVMEKQIAYPSKDSIGDQEDPSSIRNVGTFTTNTPPRNMKHDLISHRVGESPNNCKRSFELSHQSRCHSSSTDMEDDILPTRMLPTNTLPLHSEQHQPSSLQSESLSLSSVVIENDPITSTTLSLSSMQPYSSNNNNVSSSMKERAERVANALERIGKRVEDFTESREDSDGLAPREAIIPLMIESMQHHKNDCKVADRALSTLRRLTVSDVCRSRIGECGGIELVVGIMKCHSLIVRIQTQACLTLANLTYENEDNKEQVIKFGGLQTVIAALSQHKSEENVQAWGCLAIRNFTNYTGNRNNQDSHLSVEAVSVLLCALENYPDSFMVQQNGLIALVNISSSSINGLERTRDEGGIATLIECMKNNEKSEKLSEIALCLSRILVEDKKIQKSFGQYNGIEIITKIMDEHYTHIGICVKGCATFRNLAFQRENRTILGKCGSIKTIVTCLLLPFEQQHDLDIDSLSYFLKALSNSTYDSIANKTLAGRLGAIDVTLKLMMAVKYRDEGRIIVDACRALRNLVDGVSQNHRLVIKNKGIAVILDAIRLHGLRSCGVAEHGIAIFVNMSSNRSFANQIIEGSGDVVKIAKQMYNAHADNDLVKKQASSLLNLICSGRASDAQGKQGEQESLISSKSHHRFEDDPQMNLHRLRSSPSPLPRHRTD